MTLGELTANHIGRTITLADGRTRVVASMRHFRIADPADAKATLRRTSVMVGPTGAGGKTDIGEHIGDSGDKVTVGNG